MNQRVFVMHNAFDKIAGSVFSNPIMRVKSQNLASAYDVQMSAVDAIKELATKPEFVPLKNYIFQEGIALDDLITVMGIVLRDLVLESYGMKPEDVDIRTVLNVNK